jgi:hypothetical protein
MEALATPARNATPAALQLVGAVSFTNLRASPNKPSPYGGGHRFSPRGTCPTQSWFQQNRHELSILLLVLNGVGLHAPRRLELN